MSKKQDMQEVMDSVAATITQQFERRIAALEAHITDLEERLNARGIFSGDQPLTTDGWRRGVEKIINPPVEFEDRMRQHAGY